jgi:hypothetical protein
VIGEQAPDARVDPRDLPDDRHRHRVRAAEPADLLRGDQRQQAGVAQQRGLLDRRAALQLARGSVGRQPRGDVARDRDPRILCRRARLAGDRIERELGGSGHQTLWR